MYVRIVHLFTRILYVVMNESINLHSHKIMSRKNDLKVTGI